MAKIDSDFSVNHAEGATFKADGLRPYFEYRDLGIKDATKGAIALLGCPHAYRPSPALGRKPRTSSQGSSSALTTRGRKAPGG